MPQGTPARGPQIEEFDRRQAVQIGFAREGQALPLDDMFITSPINSRVRDNLYSVLVFRATRGAICGRPSRYGGEGNALHGCRAVS